jgi:hypothetical protein
MAAHYKPWCGPVKDSSMGFDNDGKWVAVEYKPKYVVDDYSTGVCPGFTLPVSEPKVQQDLYEKERQIEMKLVQEEENKPGKMKLFFDGELEEKEEAEIAVFTNEEWEEMASLVD